MHAAGPAVITEDETTIIVPASRRVIALADGCIDVCANEVSNESVKEPEAFYA
jgi:N-methylhydantoinase A